LQPQGAFSPSVETDGWRSRNPQSGFNISQPLISINGETANRQRIIQQKKQPHPCGAVSKEACHPERSEGSFHYFVRCFASLSETHFVQHDIFDFLDSPVGGGVKFIINGSKPASVYNI
jgi:hypothetical protein